MKIVIVDDELSAVEMLASGLQAVSDSQDLQIVSFTNPVEASDYLCSHPVDVVFLDIEMPVVSGMQIAEKLLERYEDPPEMIFVTAYPEYSIDAWKMEAVDYVLKPYSTDQIKKALLRSRQYQLGKQYLDTSAVYIRCFSNFDVLVNMKPVEFPSKRARELLAYLVHHQGSWVSIDSIAFDILEETPEISAKNHIRMLLSRLRHTLTQHGIGSILESRRGELRVNPSKFDCDLYDYLTGKEDSFRGSYMGDYSWAQEMRAWLCRRHEE